MHNKHVVVIGGGTGTSTVVEGLRLLPVHISALISVADSGGSTGRLRDEFGFQPVGDLRQSLAALATTKNKAWIRKLLLYRFEKGDGLAGHNLGNLLLTALQDMAGSTAKALEITEHIFQLDGSILPVTSENVQLVVEYENGYTVIGEEKLDDEKSGGNKIKKVRLSPSAPIDRRAKSAIHDADLIIIGPGDLYASVAAALSVDGMKKAFASTKAKVVYMMNLMTRYTQTHNMSARDHLAVIEKLIGRPCDTIVMNNEKIDAAALKYYAESKEYPVVNDLEDDDRVLKEELVSNVHIEQKKTDTIKRSYLRHDSKKIADVVRRFL